MCIFWGKVLYPLLGCFFFFFFDLLIFTVAGGILVSLLWNKKSKHVTVDLCQTSNCCTNIGTRVSERLWWVAHPDGHNVLHSDPTENPVLYGQLDTTHGTHIIPVRVGVLLAGRSRWKGHTGHQHPTVTGRLPTARFQNTATHFTSTAAHRQILAIYVHHEHRQHFGHRHHNQLEFQRLVNLFNFIFTGVCIFYFLIIKSPPVATSRQR